MPDQWNDAALPADTGAKPLPLIASDQGTAGVPQPGATISLSTSQPELAAAPPPLSAQTQPGAVSVTAPTVTLPGLTQAAPTFIPVPAADLPALDVGSLSLRKSSEIQGNILAGFHKDHQVFLFFGFPAQTPNLPLDQDRARQWLKELIPRLATTKEVADFNRRFSAARQVNGGDDPENMKAKWINLGLTPLGLTRLGTPQVAQDLQTFYQGHSFLTGPQVKAPDLGDVAPNSDPAHWVIGGPNQTLVDAILTVAADDPDDLLVTMEKQRALATKYGLTIIFEQRGGTLPGERAGHEHFGFKDGISQPGVLGFDHPGLDAGHSDDGKDHTREMAGSPGTLLIAPGEFVLGYPGQDPQGSAALMPARPCPAWMHDGSFQVWRRLEQDVPGFWAQATAQLAALPSDDPTTGDWLAANLMGRWRSGTPIDRAPADDNRSAQDPQNDNDFQFELRDIDGSLKLENGQPVRDTGGLQCPLHAHIRRMYPRDNSISSEMRRIIRRGIPFGLPFDPSAGRGQGVDADRGLIFMAFMGDIEVQYEFLQADWANGGIPGSSGPDSVIGQSPDGKPSSQIISRSVGPDFPVTLQRFVHTKGAVYAFAPSMKTLKSLATGTL